MAVQKPDTVSVTINNWVKFNGRKDVKHPSWFRVEVSLLDDPDFYDFTHEEFKAWLYLMARACRANSATITVNFRHAEATARISRAGMQSALQKLVDLQIVHASVTDTLRARDEDVTDPLRDRQTDRHDTTDMTDVELEQRSRTDLPAPKKSGSGKAGRGGKPKAKTADAWEAYRAAYYDRYTIDPARSSKLNSQLSQFVDLVGAEDAPHVIAFFVASDDAWYVRQRHEFGACLSNAQKLRTDWKLGATVSLGEARSIERRGEIAKGWGV